MEVKYDKTAVLEYIANFRNLQDLMRRDMDESLNKYNVCKQEYSRIFTECEEESRRAYNRVMSAEREIQMADMMMEQAMASTSDSDDEDSQLDYDMINRAQEMRRQAEADLVVAQADYSRAQDNIGKLNAVMEKYGPALEAESKVVNDSFTECSIIGSKAGEALEQYVGVMDKAYSALYESSSPQSTTSGYGSSSTGSSGNSVTAGGSSRGVAGSQSSSEPGDANSGSNSDSIGGGDGMTSSGENKGATGIQSSSQTDALNNGSGTSKGTIESPMVAVSGLGEAQTISGNNSSGTSSLLTGVAAAGVLSYMIAGQKREFANSKAGLNQAYKMAIKAKDRVAASEILSDFHKLGNTQVEKSVYANGITQTEMQVPEASENEFMREQSDETVRMETESEELPISDKMLFGFGKREIIETKMEVKERLEKCGVGEVKLEGVLERYQEMIAKDMEEMCESYPELRGYIGKISVHDLGEGVFACAGPRMDSNGYSTEIWVNRSIFSKSGLESRVYNCESSNWRGETWLAGYGPDAVLKHEMAHILHLRMIAEEQGIELGCKDRGAFTELQEKYDRNHIVCSMCYNVMKEKGISPQDLARNLSVYGSRDMGECFAEAISEYETRKNPRPYATAVYEEYKRRVNKL